MHVPRSRPAPLPRSRPHFFPFGSRNQSDQFVSLKYWDPRGAGGRERDPVRLGGGTSGGNQRLALSSRLFQSPLRQPHLARL